MNEVEEMDFEIRKMEQRDRTEVIEMMRTFYHSDAVFTNGSDTIFSNDIEACISDNPFMEGYVFAKDDHCAGYAMLAKSYSTEFGKDCIWIEDIYIKPEYQRNGIGNNFFKWLFSTYKEVIFRLEAEKENTVAVSLYKKCGFEVIPYLEMARVGTQTNE